jgi:hypothetical protein
VARLRAETPEALRTQLSARLPEYMLPAAYVRLSEAPEPADSLEIFDRLVSIAAAEPRILEIKRPVKPSSD